MQAYLGTQEKSGKMSYLVRGGGSRMLFDAMRVSCFEMFGWRGQALEDQLQIYLVL